MKKQNTLKTEEKILSQSYVTTDDLKILMPTVGDAVRRKIIHEVREEMKAKKYFVPSGKPKVALTKLVKEKLGI